MNISRAVEKGRRIFNRIKRNASTLTFVSAAFLTIFLIVGGVFNMIENPVSLVPQEGGGWTFIYPRSINYQTLSESVVAAISYILGVVGLYLIHRSTRFIYRPRQAYILLIIGLTITLLAVSYTIILLQIKLA